MAHPTDDEIELNHRIVDDLDPDGEGPIDWEAMGPVETWDAETVIIRLPRETQETPDPGQG